MFGKNEVAKLDQRADGSLLIKEIFYTLQGEGPDAGRPAVFVRLAGCNLRCYFCDTDFSGGERMALTSYVKAIESMLVHRPRCELVVITGGEPLLQNIMPLVAHINSIGRAVAIETAGTVWLPGIDDFFGAEREIGPAGGNIIVCSPKTPNINITLVPFVGAWKYIVKAGLAYTDPDNGLPVVSTQTPQSYHGIYVPDSEHPALMYLQGMDEQDDSKTRANIEAAALLCMLHGYRHSVQTHKIAGLP